MSRGLLGKKLGMTGFFTPEGRYLPVTVIEAGPCVVTQIKTRATDGYDALQLVRSGNPESTNRCRAILRKAESSASGICENLALIILRNTISVRKLRSICSMSAIASMLSVRPRGAVFPGLSNAMGSTGAP